MAENILHAEMLKSNELQVSWISPSVQKIKIKSSIGFALLQFDDGAVIPAAYNSTISLIFLWFPMYTGFI